MMKKSKILFAESKGLCKLYLRKFGNDSKNTIITTFSIIAELPCSVIDTIDTRNSIFWISIRLESSIKFQYLEKAALSKNGYCEYFI